MSVSPNCRLAAHELTVSVPGRTLVRDLDFEISAGDFLAVLGQNGTGKSLTLHTLAGLRAPAAGSVRLDAEPIDALSRRRVAQRLALLPQYTDDVFPTTVLDTALIGRHPHIGPLAVESARDRGIALESLASVDLQGLALRDVETLSGGERRRLAIAQVLAQTPAVYLLDEPTNHLDPQHQLDVLELFADLSAAGAAVVATLHDVNLAARYASRCLLLYGDGRWDLGPAEGVLDASTLSELYRVRMDTIDWRGHRQFIASRRG